MTGEKLDAAMDFAFEVSGYDAAVFTIEKYGLIGPCVIENADISKFPQLTQDFVNLVSEAKLTPVYDLQMDGAVIEAMNTGLQDLLNGTKEPADIAQAIQAEQDKL